MGDILSKIVENKRKELLINKNRSPLFTIKRDLHIQKIRNFKDAISKKDKINIIAEIKEASPSMGIFNEKLDIVKTAKSYEEGGASAISILTEMKYFLGDPSYIMKVKKNTSLPILRKDFIIDSYQVYESKYLGADAILLITAILDKDKIKEYLEIARDLDLSAIVEVHNKEELDIALDVKADIIGINNRDLKDFSVDISRTEELSKDISEDTILISESGINSKDDIKRVKSNGANAVLIGESLIKSDDIKEKLQELIRD